MQQDPEIVGVVLAGGLSRRMGGGDKGLLSLDEQPMLSHVLQRIGPQAATLILNANGDPARFSNFDLPVVADTKTGAKGPLAGVLAGMVWARQHKPTATHIVTVSSDAPFLPSNLVTRLLEGVRETGHPIALAASDGNRHPVIGLWPVALADDLAAALDKGVRKVVTWTDPHGCATVDFPLITVNGAPLDPFFNANTPEELDAARAILQTTPSIP